MGETVNAVAAVVVTYNRLELLKENIEALLSQSAPCDVFLINNNSTDGTEEYILSLKEDRIHYFNTKENLGGAGGFSYGIKRAESAGYQYLWVMDDDSIPKGDALESLLRKANELNNEFSFLASLVFWSDGSLFPMNIPIIDFEKGGKNIALIDNVRTNRVLPIKASSFVGCFINTKVSVDAGLPIASFFIYGDDIEYTTRLSGSKAAYLDLDSQIVHKAPSKTGASIVYAPKDRIDRFYYQSRNGMYIGRKKGIKGVFNRLLVVLKRAWNIIRKAEDSKGKRIRVLLWGTVCGFFFNPKIDYSSDKNDINGSN